MTYSLCPGLKALMCVQIMLLYQLVTHKELLKCVKSKPHVWSVMHLYLSLETCFMCTKVRNKALRKHLAVFVLRVLSAYLAARLCVLGLCVLGFINILCSGLPNRIRMSLQFACS